ncbi:hypothetical protein ABZ916_37145 [Streptomyces sp. NPDC046853]|uniref:hypothetical protein n=1 Tax=Streptomyces sp. NPDC046853 TaxID=3154920 RepID=UPI0033F7B454
MGKIKRIGACVVAVAALSASAPAFAYSIATDGAYAYTSKSTTVANIKDTKKDGHPVKIQYYRLYSSGDLRTIWEKRGYGNTNSSKPGSYILKIKACEYINSWPDDCTSWTDGTIPGAG